MVYREIIAVCSEIHTKHINTLCGQNVELLNVKPGGTYNNHFCFKGLRDQKKSHVTRVAYGQSLWKPAKSSRCVQSW